MFDLANHATWPSTVETGHGRRGAKCAEARVKANRDKFIAVTVAIQSQTAQDAGALGFQARVLVQATLPHSAKSGNEFTRVNGNLTLTILSPSEVGLPYGSYPRILLTWLTTEAVRTKNSTIYLGENMSQFMAKLGLVPSGGQWGTVPRLRDQTNRLFKSHITVTETSCVNGLTRHRGRNAIVAEEWDLWWGVGEAEEEISSSISWVKLNDEFFRQVIERPVPVDMRAIRALRRSPMALDVYVWATYRMMYMRQRTEIPWAALYGQFGAAYASSAQGLRDFRRKFLDALRKVSTIYPALRASLGRNGLVLKPSPTHVRRAGQR